MTRRIILGAVYGFVAPTGRFDSDGGRTLNYSRLAGEHGAAVGTTVTIGYDAPWRQVHALLVRALLVRAAQKTGHERYNKTRLFLSRFLALAVGGQRLAT